ncbi:MAG: malto-oligosyltrehalose trehalohydrolase [Chloroflexi bacterium]|nr:malto-oligosyltrehalose trehalohydrolase [Chloroflexota bacterium]
MDTTAPHGHGAAPVRSVPDLSLGAGYLGEGRCRFRVWAPSARQVEVRLVSPQERLVPLERRERGYFAATVEGVAPGTQYLYRLDGERERPDPASRFQPQGVHRPSAVVDPAFPWEDGAWCGLPLSQYVLYELHVGAFTPEGTFDAIIPHLDDLKDLGITAIELMPVAQFPGGRNWGYDGVHPYAVQDSYGGPEGLKRLVTACHQRGLAVVLDVVYNHLGPEGNYLGEFGPYFTDRYRTPWGFAINFDGPHSDEVRHFFIENALFWITEYHIDALRLDALHAIFDFSARPFLEELAVAVQEQAERCNRRAYLIAESDLNDTRLIRPRELGGFGLDAQWNDDFHHALHTLLTREQTGYYQDFGLLAQLVKAFREGYVYSGQYAPYRQRRHGNDSRPLPARQFVVFTQNHDQVGNRMLGERLSRLVSFDALKLAAGVVLLSPFLPLLFMGEEYGETAPFPYFISHLDPGLVEAVRRGRREEFAAFAWQGEPPDPQDEATFLQAKLDHRLRHQGQHRTLRAFFRELLRLRRELPALAYLSKDHLEVTGYEREQVLSLRCWYDASDIFAVVNFSEAPVALALPVPAGRWHKQLDSADERWEGPGSVLPERLDGEAEPVLSLPPRMLALFSREAGT